MELMQLQMLVAVAEEGTLQKAAGRVCRTAPAVSIAIAKLEEEIGTALFDRSLGRDFRLTTAGEVLVGYAKRLLSLRDEALAAVGEVKNAKRGHLRIGANQSIGEYILPHLTKAFLERYPDVKLKVVIGYSDAVLAALKHHDLDLALVASQTRDPALQANVLLHDRLVAVMNPAHRLSSSKDVIPIKELGVESLILLTATSELRERVVETFRRSGVPLNVRVETETLESIKKMAAQNMGIGIVPRMCVREENGSKLVVKTIAEFREERTHWLVSRRQAAEPSPVCQAFLKLIKSELKRHVAESGERGAG